MASFLRRIRSVERWIAHAEEWFAMALVAALGIVVNLQIFARYVFNAPFIWPEEVSRLLLVWMTFIGSAALVRRGSEIAVDTFVLMLPSHARRTALACRDVVLVLLFGFIALEGFRLAQAVAGMPLIATDLPTSMLAWPIVVGGGLTAFHSAIRLAGTLTQRDGAQSHVEVSL